MNSNTIMQITERTRREIINQENRRKEVADFLETCYFDEIVEVFREECPMLTRAEMIAIIMKQPQLVIDRIHRGAALDQPQLDMDEQDQK